MPDEQTKRILVVDDHPDNIQLLRARLEARGYIVEEAADGEAALARVYTSPPPDLILLDVMMPKIDGLEVARRIKSDDSLPFIPVIMQTALDSTESMVQGFEAGADDYIAKPVNFRELDARVRSLLRIQTLQSALEQRERELSAANAQLLVLSSTDVLTGVANRRALEERLHDMWEHSQRLHEPLSVVMCDIDHFKRVNDEYGHQVGDVVLQQFAHLLVTEAREIDRVGRYGGEEFVLLLPGTVLDAAVTFAERIRACVEKREFTYDDGQTLHRTMSCGIAAWPHPLVADQEALIKAADDALYVAKETGRNRVVRFDSREFNEHIAKNGKTDETI
ncbi:MAG TPA: diguanylate cyclase [Gemmatimonadaceae bacterium]|nr:diguanylate cyclase [Gemmatimonadaceae bacterium]